MKKNNGFTLVEVLIYIAVFSVIIVVTGFFILWLINSSSKIKVMREVNDNARIAMETMISEIKEAKSIYTPTSASRQISLETSKYLPQGEEASYIDFYEDNGTLFFKKESEDPVSLTSSLVEIKDINFTQVVYEKSYSIKIEMTVAYRNISGRPEYDAEITLTSTAFIRSN
ncbi:MAG: type II secretion system protein [Candidatus Pacebacteria bacterium]|nr:type II secretion system protein [Candidatus Paceibacterota bacterium]